MPNAIRLTDFENGENDSRRRLKHWLCWLLLIGFISVQADAAIRLSGLDFWYFENLENESLRGGEFQPLNTRPLVLRQELSTKKGAIVDRINLEYGHSDGTGLEVERRIGSKPVSKSD
jgi:hypothetical protein